ncbi:MAG TPA: DUF6586 family protein [Pseudomonadales bacterium]
MASLASRVNEKHYHAALLLDLRQQLDPHSDAYMAQCRALEQAAIDAMQRAWLLFLHEVAESCQLKVAVDSLSDLRRQLTQDNRSHAVVATLSVLEQQPASWLSQLLAASQITADQPQSRRQPATVLVVADITGQPDWRDCLAQFQACVAEQRDYLQEW